MTADALAHDPTVHHALLWLSALCGGALNAVAGGGSFFTFPALILMGVPPVVANATSTVALWPGSVASALAYRRELGRRREGLIPLSLASLVGGGLGAWLLLWSGDVTFARVVPWLLLTATLLFAASGPLVSRLRAAGRHKTHASPGIFGILVQLAVAVYGGYFGGGMGILMLAAFALSGLPDVHEANARKSWLGALINGVAVVTFVGAGAVRLPEALVMVIGASMGGYGGAALARRVEPAPVRRFIVGAGLVLTVVFFLR